MSAPDSATPKKLYPLGVSFWPDQMRFERIGCYDVTALIGEGGMGQVYQATDTKLNRQVALKILPEAFALIRIGCGGPRSAAI